MHMHKRLLILFVLLPTIILAAYMSRPFRVSTQQELKSPPVEPQSPAEERVKNPRIAIEPLHPIQGEPVLVKVLDLSSTTTIRALKFHNEPLSVFTENGQLKALIGLDLRLPSTEYPITLTLSDGRVIQENVDVGERVIATAPLGIPEKLGGNTKSSQDALISSLVEEGKLINSIESTTTKLWLGPFRYPLENPITVTDVYGYSRQTVGTTLSHKGTDYRAAVGTPVYAMNSGLVAYTGYLRNYGHTAIIDHGLGLQTIYMHLSSVEVRKGDMVKRGDLVAYSGETGYVLGPHLHISIKINHVSIDPEKFMEIMGVK